MILANVVLGDVFAGFMMGVGVASLILALTMGRLISNLRQSLDSLVELNRRIHEDPNDDLLRSLGMHDFEE